MNSLRMCSYPLRQKPPAVNTYKSLLNLVNTLRIIACFANGCFRNVILSYQVGIVLVLTNV
jgi:hypothetical protein